VLAPPQNNQGKKEGADQLASKKPSPVLSSRQCDIIQNLDQGTMSNGIAAACSRRSASTVVLGKPSRLA